MFSIIHFFLRNIFLKKEIWRLLTILLIVAPSVFAQNPSQRCKWVTYQREAFTLDSLTVLPQSLDVQIAPNEEVALLYDWNNNQVRFNQILKANDSVFVCYQVLPFNITEPVFKRDVNAYKDSSEKYLDVYYIPPNNFQAEREELFALEGFQKSGSLTRGISFGNTQNVFVNSGLNLQLEGPLTEKLKLRAVINDQNIPFQPEGNTQQIQGFDRVFVQLEHQNATLTAGDVVFQNPESYFLKYYKNVQGALLETRYQAFEISDAVTNFGVAVSKGKFASIQVEPIEGVQGPYRLQGPNNETFIIVLANSEKVFLDGKLLQRGFNNDYVIDYNLGEIIFNNQIIITQFSRIRVDFEFSERNYSRSILTANHRQNFDWGHVFINFYQVADNPNNVLGFDLSEEDLEQLTQAGDDPLLAIINSVDSVEFNENQVLYRQIDTTINNILYQNILVFSTNPNDAFYNVLFSDVGQGNGDYNQVTTTINGRVFEWQAPVNGIRQGRFAPVQLVATPTKQQMVTLGGEFQLTEKDKIFGEIAFTEEDLNRYSDIDNSDNQGQAFKIGYKNEGRAFPLWDNFEWVGSIDYEQDSRYFRPIDRFRSIEFERDWGITLLDTSQVEDNIFNFTFGIRKKRDNPQKVVQSDSLLIPPPLVPITDNNAIPQQARREDIEQPTYQQNVENDHILYRFTYRNRTDQINGWQQELNFQKDIQQIRVKGSGFLLKNELPETLITWERLNTDISWQNGLLIPGYVFTWDKNQTKVIDTDSIANSLMNFESHQFYLKTADTLRTQFRLDYTFRDDFTPQNGELKKSLTSHTVNLGVQTQLFRTQFLGIIFTYRELQNQLDNSENLNESNITSRLDWNGSFLKNHIRSELTLASSTGRELQREFVFLPVNNGEGTHTWRDENDDGIQDLNEFYLALNPDERNFIKVFVPTNEFITAFTNNFSYRLNWQAPRSWKEATGFQGFLGNFSQVLSWTINRRMTNEDLTNRFVPFLTIDDTEILSTQEVLRTTLFYNRTNPSFGFDFTYIQTEQKQLLTNGFESRLQEEYKLGIRRNLGRYFNIRLEGSQIFLNNRSDFLLTRNYDILTYILQPEMSFQPSPTFRITGRYVYSEKFNVFSPESLEQTVSNQAILEARVSKAGNLNFNAQLRFLDIFYQGEVNTPIGYEMLEALQPGNNWTWNVNWQQNLLNGLRLTLTYEGRSSPLVPVVHIGRAQIVALF